MTLDKLFEESFEDVLKYGRVTREISLGDNLKLKIRPISESDLVEARLAIPKRAKEDILTYGSIESFEILSRAIVEINGLEIIAMAEEEIKGSKAVMSAKELALSTIRTYLGKLPPKLLNYLSENYNDLVREQYESMKKDIGENIENF